MKQTINDYCIFNNFAWIKLANSEDKIFFEFNPIYGEYELGGIGDDITYDTKIVIEDLKIYKIETPQEIISDPIKIYRYYQPTDELFNELTTIIENQIN